MQRNYGFLLILLLAGLSGFTTQATDYAAKVVKHCKDFDFVKMGQDGNKRLDKRKDNDQVFGLEYNDIVKFRQDDEYGAIYEGNEGAALIFSIIIISIALLLSIFCLLNICFCNKTKERPFVKKLCFYMASVFYVCFFVFLILIIVYSYKSHDQVERLKCIGSKFAEDIVNGVDSNETKFVGFSKLLNTLKEYKVEIGQIKSLVPKFEAIENKKLDEESADVIASLSPFRSTYENSQIKLGDGTTGVPTSNTHLPLTVEEIKKEFLQYNKVAKSITNSAKIGKTFDTDAEIDTAIAALVDATDVINKINADTIKVSDDFYDMIQHVSDSISFYGMITVLISVGLLIIFKLILVIFFFQIKKKICMRCTCMFKSFLIVLAICVFLFSFVSLGLFGFASLTGSMCHLFERILTSEDNGNLFKDLDISITNQEEMTKALNNCIVVGNSGNLNYLVDNTNFDEPDDIFDGLTELNNFKAQFDAAGDESISIKNIVEGWTFLKDGKTYNTIEVQDELDEVNDDIDCDDQMLILNPFNCLKEMTCHQVSNLTEFSGPKCAENDDVRASFAKIKEYDDENKALMGNMITDLDGTANTPHSKFKNMRESFKFVYTEFTDIQTTFSKSLASLNTFKEGFGDLTSCRIIRKEILYWEDTICFGLSQHIAYLFFFFSSLVILMILMVVAIWIIMRYSPKPLKDEIDGYSFDNNANEQKVLVSGIRSPRVSKGKKSKDEKKNNDKKKDDKKKDDKKKDDKKKK